MEGNKTEEHFKFRLPLEAMDEIFEYTALNKDVYASYIDFCTEAIRKRLDEIHWEMQEKERMKNPSILARANAIHERLDEMAREDAKRNDEEIIRLYKKRKD
jgi:hypothetical protein